MNWTQVEINGVTVSDERKQRRENKRSRGEEDSQL